jgi:rod shape-determining protein MreC
MRRSNIVALVIFLIAVGIVLSLNPRNTNKVQSAFLGLVAPFFRTGSSMQVRISNYRTGLKTLAQLEQDNKLLVTQNRELKTINETLRDMEQENNRLRRAIGYEERSVFQLIPARIITRDSGTWWSTVKIDRGFDDGVDPDMPVLTEDGLVGKTTTVSKNVSTVLLIADENCKVAASVEGTREQGIVRGERTSTTNMPDITLNFLSKTADLKPGQKVYTSGVGGVYPSGVAIGTTKDFKVRELDGQATLFPAVDLTTLQDVFIVVGKK